ncbi:MAG: phosphate ABC transporter permease PstA [Actinomycetota bacterium]
MTLIDEPPSAEVDLEEVRPARPRTVLPADRPQGPKVGPRQVGGVAREDLLALGGALVSSVSLTALLFGTFAAFSGRLGFTIVWFGLFIAIYAALVALDNDTPAVVDRVMTAVLSAATLLALVALASVIIYVLYGARGVLTNVNFYTEDMRATGPGDPLSSGGIRHAIIGTLIIISVALLLTVPLGIACAVYLYESRSRFAELVRTVVTAMTALPSIVAGLFIFATWVLILGYPRGGFAGSLAISLMILPIIIRSADVVLRLVPGSLREASAALGAPTWRTVWHVVLPTARSGLSTAVILGVARGIGETAPVLLTSGFTQTTNVNLFENAMLSLPLQTFEFSRSPDPLFQERGFATAAVLMVLVLALFALARFLGGRPAGVLSKRQIKAATRKSAADEERMAARSRGRSGS